MLSTLPSILLGIAIGSLPQIVFLIASIYLASVVKHLSANLLAIGALLILLGSLNSVFMVPLYFYGGSATSKENILTVSAVLYALNSIGLLLVAVGVGLLASKLQRN